MKCLEWANPETVDLWLQGPGGRDKGGVTANGHGVFLGGDVLELVVRAAQPCEYTETTTVYFERVNFRNVINISIKIKKLSSGSQESWVEKAAPKP